jgi:uncharacterized protein YndB with AHSA1/START domain
MHLLAEASVEIERPTVAVFEYVTNMERFHEWFPGVLTIASVDDTPHGQPGKEYLETVMLPLQGPRQIKLVVRETRANELFVTEGSLPLLMPRMEITFFELNAALCRLTWRMRSRNDGYLARCLVLPLARQVLAKRAAAGVRSLKSRLEQGRQPRST